MVVTILKIIGLYLLDERRKLPASKILKMNKQSRKLFSIGCKKGNAKKIPVRQKRFEFDRTAWS